MYIINRLELNNFKLVEGKKIIDFSKNNLVVLDGPNGYGKTSIFDSIEILVKGNRNLDKVFNCEYKDGDKPVVYAYNINKPIILKGEFLSDDGNKVIIMRKIEDPKSTGKIGDLKDRFEIYQLNKFEDNDGKSITQEYINTLFGLYPNEEVYNLIYYIQQEETLFFLKENEFKRKELLNNLFNMEKESTEYGTIIKLRDKLNLKRKEIGGTNGKEGRIGNIDREIGGMIIKDSSNVKYKKLIKDKNIIWDKEILELEYNDIQKSILRLEKIKLLRSNLNDYEAILYNNKIDFSIDINQEDILKGSFVPKEYINDYGNIKKKINLIDYYKRFLQILESDKYSYIKEFLNEENEFKNILEGEFDLNEFSSNITKIIDGIKNATQLDSLIININSIRNNLTEQYKKYALNNNDEDICPLCGYNYKELDLNLIDKIKEKEKYFNDQLDITNNNLNELINITKKKFINSIATFLQVEIENKEISEEYEMLLDTANLNKERINGFDEFCKKNNLTLEKYLLKSEDYSNEKLENNLKLLKDELSSKKREVLNEEIILHKNELDGIFISLFDKDIEKIRQLNINDIDNKRLYIESIYNDQEKMKKMKKVREKGILVKQYLKLDEEYKKCKKLAETYKECMGKYSDKIIKILQIPLYIYSGKIIQDYQGGLGVFIRREEGEQQLRLKFVNNNNSRHDLINKFSSGQLSGLILSIMLSLNKVLSNNKFNTILIDDPLQSMDDINMTSFVELLRNEFYKSQIIISTHDERISRYIRYKFVKLNLKATRYNVKDELRV